MIVGIGCDVVDHDITIKLNWETSTSSQTRVFSQCELDIYSINKTINFLSGRFAAKEAILKCLGTGMKDGIALTDIQILQSESGQPMIKLGGVAKAISDSMDINLWHISISHSDKHSIAFVIAERIKI